MCIEKYVRNLGFALAAIGVVFGVELHLRVSARGQRAGALKTCPRSETALMSAHTCLSVVSASSADARAVMRASSVAVRPMSSSTSTERPTSGRDGDHARRHHVAHREPAWRFGGHDDVARQHLDLDSLTGVCAFELHAQRRHRRRARWRGRPSRFVPRRPRPPRPPNRVRRWRAGASRGSWSRCRPRRRCVRHPAARRE